MASKIPTPKLKGSIEYQQQGHVERAIKAGLGPLIKKNRDKIDDSYSGSKGYFDKDLAKSEQVIKGYFSGNLRSKKPIAQVSDGDTDEQNAVTNYNRQIASFQKRLKNLSDTAKPAKMIQVNPGKWKTVNNLVKLGTFGD